MAPTLESFLGPSVELGALLADGPLGCFPIFGVARGGPVLGLEQALARGAVAKELPEPVVDRILVHNPTPHALLLVDGEEIIGAQQNRVLDGTVLIPPGVEREVAVCCVEEGRWDASQRASAFQASPQVVPPSLRAVKSRTGRHTGRGDQDAVWTEVRSRVTATGTFTATTAMTDIFAARRDTLESLVGRHTAQDGQQGMVVVVGSRIWAIDVVSDPALFARLMPRLLRGYALDALGIRAPAAVSREEAELALRRLARRPLEAQPTDGPEQRFGFGGEGLAVEGSATLYEGSLAAMSALLPGAPQGASADLRSRPRTSETHPIEVSWVPFASAGRLGLTFAPGKRASSTSGAPWSRDLELDLLRLRAHHRVDALVCLLSDAELSSLGVEGYAARVAAHGMELLRLPVRDGEVPPDAGEAAALVAQIAGRLEAGSRVVVHCRGGLGRAGTIAGCALVATGVAPGRALEALRARHPQSCPENERQREYIRRFAARRAS